MAINYDVTDNFPDCREAVMLKTEDGVTQIYMRPLVGVSRLIRVRLTQDLVRKAAALDE